MDEDKSILQQEGSVSQPVQHLQKILILERLNRMLDSWEAYKESTEGSGDKAKYARKVRSKASTLMSILMHRMKKQKGDKKNYEYDSDVINKLLLRTLPGQERIEYDNFETAINLIQAYLELDLKLTHIDTRIEYDYNSLKERNKAKLGY